MKNKKKKNNKTNYNKKQNKFKETRYYKLHKYFIDHPKALIIKDVIFIITMLATVLTIKDSIISSYNRLYGTDSAALKYYKIGQKYYEDKEYHNSLEEFKKVISINQNLLDSKYYYTMSLLYDDFENNSKLARKTLYENSEHMNDNEKVVYALLNHNLQKNVDGFDVLKEIKEPILLKNEMFVKYIEVYTNLAFSISFEYGQNTVFNNKMLIDRKIRSLGELDYSNPIRKFDDVTLSISIDGKTMEEKAKLEQAAILMYTLYFDKCSERKEYGKLLPILELASDYFNIFSTEEAIAKEYLHYVYDYVDSFPEYENIHLKGLKVILDTTISKVKEGNQEIWGQDLMKLKGIYNNIINEYQTDWKPYT